MSELIGRISDWIVLHTPVQCQVCYKWLFRKDAIYKQITIGGQVPLCESCDKAIFRPFTRGQLN